MPRKCRGPIGLNGGVLAEARSELVSRGFTPVDAEAELRRAIRDAVLPGASGSGLHIRLDGSDNPWFSSRVGPWLRNSPELDFDASTILILEWRALPLGTIETTLRLVHGQPLAARICRPARIEILDADIDRIWGPENGREMPAEPDAPEPGEPDTASPAASERAVDEQPSPLEAAPRRRGAPRDKRDRVVAEVNKQLDSGTLTMERLETYKKLGLGATFATSDDTACRAREEVLQDRAK